MKRNVLLLWIAVGLCGCVLIAQAAQSSKLVETPPVQPANNGKVAPGIEAAQTISMLTGVAISPMLGVSAVGAWKYFHAPREQRANLPWFAQPWFWMAGLALVGLVTAKDILGPAVPTILKKPFDVAEAVENKVSGLVATGAFVPAAATFFSVAREAASAAIGGPIIAGIDPANIGNALLVPFAMVAFAMVWVVGHAINMLILISPFATVDAGLKAFRAFILSTVCLTSFANPYFGAVWAGLIIITCYFLAGWAFRLTVYGTLFIGDYVTFKRKRFIPDDTVNGMFLAREIKDVPIRTYGKLRRTEAGDFEFEYKPWLILPPRTMALPKGEYAVGHSLLCPEIHRVDGEDSWSVLLLLPRFITHEERLAKACGIPVIDVGVLKGAKSLWNFVKRLCGVKVPGPVPATT